MGSEASTFCSVDEPGGYKKPMKMASADTLRHDRIDMWSKDMGDGVECSRLTAVMTCGGNTQPPQDYLADTPQHGSIVLEDWREGPFWSDDVHGAEADSQSDRSPANAHRQEVKAPGAAALCRRESSADSIHMF
mmetsp:Transcript_55231/g.124417  ORF Transcript_55231/g.124417 Transcript_55231/m.124417 type:complete len:134 (-) Transcript_55231:135-536(-)